MMNKFVFWCFTVVGTALEKQPVKIQSTSYPDTIKRERSQSDIIAQTAQELSNLPRFRAYAKVLQEAGDGQAVLKQQLQTIPLPPAADGDDHSTLANLNAIEAGILRRRQVIEEEIRERRSKWRIGQTFPQQPSCEPSSEQRSPQDHEPGKKPDEPPPAWD